MPTDAQSDGRLPGTRAQEQCSDRRDRIGSPDVRENQIVPVPKHLRCSHYSGASDLGHGEGYQYSHDAEGGVAAQDYLGVDRTYYEPVDRGFEAELQTRLAEIKRRLKD